MFDLTVHHDFSGDIGDIREALKKVRAECLGTRYYPWIFKDYTKSFHGTLEDEIFLTGNSEERASKKEYRRYCENIVCERCGKDLSIKPWEYHDSFCLCSECDELLEAERHHINYREPWRIEE